MDAPSASPGPPSSSGPDQAGILSLRRWQRPRRRLPDNTTCCTSRSGHSRIPSLQPRASMKQRVPFVRIRFCFPVVVTTTTPSDPLSAAPPLPSFAGYRRASLPFPHGESMALRSARTMGREVNDQPCKATVRRPTPYLTELSEHAVPSLMVRRFLSKVGPRDGAS